jgi:hypothetical protein
MAYLVRAAITVGSTPIALGSQQRPMIELIWRAAMAEANVAWRPPGTWTRSDAYDRLDGSEKSAVSYFLGMTQAKLTCECLLNAPHLMHLDALLAIKGKPASKTRPDLVGVDIPTMNCTIAVEAKGRSGGFDRPTVVSAKKQATSIPAFLTTVSTIRVASLAYFTNSGWHAYLEDPEDESEASDLILTIEQLLVSYYRPLVATLRTAGVTEADTSDDSTVVRQIPGIDLSLGLPRSIVSILSDVPSIGALTDDQIQRVGSALREEVRRLYDRVRPGQTDREASALSRRAFGLDWVLVELGQSWPDH